MLPFVKNVMPQLGMLYIFLAYFVIVGTSNAVNLTDGLDGLAIVPDNGSGRFCRICLCNW